MTEGFVCVHAPVAFGEGKEQTSSVAQAPPVAPRTVVATFDAQFATGGGSRAMMEGFVCVHAPVAFGEGKEQTSVATFDAQFATGGGSRAIKGDQHG